MVELNFHCPELPSDCEILQILAAHAEGGRPAPLHLFPEEIRERAAELAALVASGH